MRVGGGPDLVPVTRVHPAHAPSLYTTPQEWWRVDEGDPAPRMGPGYLLVALHHPPHPPVLPMAPFDLAAILENPREGMYHGRAQTCGVVKRNSWPGTETHTLTLISHTHSPALVCHAPLNLARSLTPTCVYVCLHLVSRGKLAVRGNNNCIFYECSRVSRSKTPQFQSRDRRMRFVIYDMSQMK